MGVADNKFINAHLYKPLVHGDESVPCELHCEGQNLNRLMRDHGFAAPITPAASPKRAPDQQQQQQQGSQNGFGGGGGGGQQAPRQQRQGGGHQQQNQQQHQNRQQEDGAGWKQGTSNRQGSGGGGRAQRNDAQLESANREIKGLKGDVAKLDKQLLALKTENVSC